MMLAPDALLLPLTFKHWPLWSACATTAAAGVTSPDATVQMKFPAVEQVDCTTAA